MVTIKLTQTTQLIKKRLMQIHRKQKNKELDEVFYQTKIQNYNI